MCVYSNVAGTVIGDRGRRVYPQPSAPWTVPWAPMPFPADPGLHPLPPAPVLSPEEIQAVRELLEKAQRYDTVTGQERCELEEKKKRLRELARELGATITLPGDEE